MTTTTDLPRFENYCNKTGKAQVFSVGGVDVYFSFRTPVAFRVGDCLTVRRNSWGPTTGRHLNAIDDGNKAARLAGPEFEAALALATGGN